MALHIVATWPPQNFSKISLEIMTWSQVRPEDVRRCVCNAWLGGAPRRAATPNPQINQPQVEKPPIAAASFNVLPNLL